MKLLVTFLGLIIIIAFAGANNITENEEISISPRIDLAPIVQKLIESLKESGKYDPIVLEEKNLHIDDKNLDIKLDGAFKGALKGLLGVEVKKLIANFLLYNFEFVLPELHLDISKYNFEGWFGLIKIFGDGKLSVKLTNTVMKGNGMVTYETVDGVHYILVKNIKPDLNINQLDFKITGYLNDKYRSEMISKTITNIAPAIIKQYKAKINEAIATKVMQLIGGFRFPFPK